MNSVTLKPNREKATLGFHPWIFSGAIASVTPGTRDGDIVAIHRYRGGQIATGYYNSKSSIAIRILAWGALPPDMDDLVTSRISEAIARRHGIMDDRSNACRLIFSEGDCLPGLIVDQYAGYLVVQFLTLGMDQLRDRVIEALQSLLSPVGIYERSDAASRKKDGLDPSCGLLAGAQIPDDLEIMVQGLSLIHI